MTPAPTCSTCSGRGPTRRTTWLDGAWRPCNNAAYHDNQMGNLPAQEADDEVAERYDCIIHGTGDGPDCPRC